MIPPPVGIDWSAPWHEILHLWHAHIDTAVHQFAFLPWSAVVMHTSKRCLRKDGCDAVWTGRHPTTGDVADLLLLGMRRYVLSSAGNNLVIGGKHPSTETWHRFESDFVAFITGR